MEVNYTLVIIATIAQFALGALWYSPLLFGKWWQDCMEMDCSALPPEEMKKLQKSMTPFYVLQLFLTFFTTISFANLVSYINAFNIYHIGFWIWIGFIVPVEISSVIWGSTKKKYWCKQIFVMVANQFVNIMLVAWILSM